MVESPPRHRRRWPLVLISSALLLLVVGAIAIGQLYWSGLHGGMARMRASMDEASRQQVFLAEQVRAAQAALRDREAELDRREAELERRGLGGADLGPMSGGQSAQVQQSFVTDPSTEPSTGATVSGLGPLPMTLDGIEKKRLHALLVSTSREVARLPLSPWRIQRGGRSSGQVAPATAKQLLKAQLQVAEGAVALADPLLLDMAIAVAQRLLIETYDRGGGSRRAREIGVELGELRAALRMLAVPRPPR